MIYFGFANLTQMCINKLCSAFRKYMFIRIMPLIEFSKKVKNLCILLIAMNMWKYFSIIVSSDSVFYTYNLVSTIYIFKVGQFVHNATLDREASVQRLAEGP